VQESFQKGKREKNIVETVSIICLGIQTKDILSHLFLKKYI